MCPFLNSGVPILLRGPEFLAIRPTSISQQTESKSSPTTSELLVIESSKLGEAARRTEWALTLGAPMSIQPEDNALIVT